MTKNANENIIKATAIRTYPATNSADPKLQIELLHLWESGRKFFILSGPPGVGKTRAAEDFILEILNKLETTHDQHDCRLSDVFPDFRNRVYTTEQIEKVLINHNISFIWDICVLHPQYAYEDLIRGYRLYPVAGGVSLQVRDGILGFLCRVVSVLETLRGKSSAPRGAIIMDEINRAPIGQIFGEAVYGLDRRGELVSTPYELDGVGCNVSFPHDLVIIGTMNSIDRATAGFDFALRRRFILVSMSPSKVPIEDYFSKIGANAKAIALELFSRLSDLVLSAEQSGVIPNRELVLGHAYFMFAKSPENEGVAIDWLVDAYLYKILPTLIDYKEQGLIEYKKEALNRIPLWQLLSGELATSIDPHASVRESLQAYLTH